MQKKDQDIHRFSFTVVWNQWLGFRLLAAIPEVLVGHNSRENRTSYHHHGGCVLGLFPNPGVKSERLCSRWQSSLLCDGTCFELIPPGVKDSSFLSPFLPHPCPLWQLWPFHLKWPDPDSSTKVAEWNDHNHEPEEKSSNQTWRCLGTSASSPLLLSWQKLMLDRLFPKTRLIYFHQIFSCHRPQVCLD